MRPVVVLVGLLVMNAFLLPPLLRWVARSADWLRDPALRGRVVTRYALDQLAQSLIWWRWPDRSNPLTQLLFALAVTAALLWAEASTLQREWPALFRR